MMFPVNDATNGPIDLTLVIRTTRTPSSALARDAHHAVPSGWNPFLPTLRLDLRTVPTRATGDRFDLGVINRYVADTLFEGRAWVLNGAGCALPNHRMLYACRARDLRTRYNRSHVAATVLNLRPVPRCVAPVALIDVRPRAADDVTGDTGPQDARLFRYEGHVWMVYNMATGANTRRVFIQRVADLEGTLLRDTRPVELTFPELRLRAVEKNWTPFVHCDQLCFVYSFSPLVLLRCPEPSTGVCTFLAGTKTRRVGAALRGGSPATFCARDGCYTGYLHTVSLPRNAYDPRRLPLPVRKLRTVYQAVRFNLYPPNETRRTWSLALVRERLDYPEHQLVQSNTFDPESNTKITNVDDRFTVLQVPRCPGR